jgi:D-alanyl-D-alanine carboxypeptidase
VLRLLALPLVALAVGQSVEPYGSLVRPLPAPLKQSMQPESWRPGCPVALADLRLLTVKHWGFDGRVRLGQLVVHEDVARPLATVFERLYELRFPIRHMQLDDMYGPKGARPKDGDVTGSFRCRQSVPSPCVGGSRSGRWSNHAYGLAIDINPVENPYVGCGMSRDPKSLRYVDRTPIRRGMVTPAVVQAFRSIGWGWGGEWGGETKDYMHFSHNGR